MSISQRPRQRMSLAFAYNSIAAALGAIVLLALFGVAPASAQNTGIMSPGSAAVTAFSGVPNYPTEQRIDTDGPSLRVIALPGGPNGLDSVPKPFTVTAKDVGQVFGVALDDQPNPDIFVAATSAYGLGIYQPGAGRLQRGAPGAQFTPGLFGPTDQGGGPGSIWRIDGTTGQVSLFTNVTFNGMPESPASLGGLAFDARTQQLFAVDRATGIIHRYSMDGTDRGAFDHGFDGRREAGLPPVPFNPSTLADINSPNFDSQNPRSWGFAPVPRRIFGLAVRGARLFYAVADGPQIWSVGIRQDGSFGNDAHFEAAAPALVPGTEISQIAFDGHPHMYVAERAPSTGAPDFRNVANGGQDRVERFSPKNYGDPSPGYWQPPGDQYAIGMLPQFQNADGGVDIKCGSSVWATGEQLLNPGNAPPGSFPMVDGLQGTDANLVEPANMPPQQSRYVNYYDNQADPNSHGHMGGIAILNVCTGGGYVPPPPPVQIGYGCPPGTLEMEGSCLIPPSCPEDSIFRDGYCIYPHCPEGFIRLRGTCAPPPRVCHFGEVFINDRCFPIGCPPGLERGDRGYCHCPEGRQYRDGRCGEPQCPRDTQFRDGRCFPIGCPPDRPRMENGQCGCPRDEQYRDGRCVQGCPPGMQQIDNGKCGCPRDEQYRDGRCVQGCPPGMQQIDNGKCGCPRDEQYRDGRCVEGCPPGMQQMDNGKCGCPRDEQYRDGRCVEGCPPGMQQMDNGKCGCPRDEQYRDGRCVQGCPPSQVILNSDTGQCGCPRGELLQDGRCIKCPPGAGETGFDNGQCGCPPGESWQNCRCVGTGNCPPGLVILNSDTGQCGCPRGELLQDGHCNKCPPGAGATGFDNGQCGCPPGESWQNCHCVNPNITPSCPKGEIRRDGRCVATNTGGTCTREMYDEGLCHHITTGGNSSGTCTRAMYDQGLCSHITGSGTGVLTTCTREQADEGLCHRTTTGTTCSKGEHLVDGVCRKDVTLTRSCPKGETMVDGECREQSRTLNTTIRPECPTGEIYRDGGCHTTGKHRTSDTGGSQTYGTQNSNGSGQTYGTHKTYGNVQTYGNQNTGNGQTYGNHKVFERTNTFVPSNNGGSTYNAGQTGKTRCPRGQAMRDGHCVGG